MVNYCADGKSNGPVILSTTTSSGFNRHFSTHSRPSFASAFATARPHEEGLSWFLVRTKQLSQTLTTRDDDIEKIVDPLETQILDQKLFVVGMGGIGNIPRGFDSSRRRPVPRHTIR